MRNFCFFFASCLFFGIFIESCSNADATVPASKEAQTKVEKPKAPVYRIVANGETYKSVRKVQTDSSGCITFHVEEKKGCGCSGGTPAKDVKICGSYLIETTMETQD